MPDNTFVVLVQNWVERESGWGMRPDGFTIHISKEQHKLYVDYYMKTYNNLPQAPDEYTTVDGAPIEIEVDGELYNRIKRASEAKREDGTVLSVVHGNGKFFSTSPMRPLRDGDISWPKAKKLTETEIVIEKIAAWAEKLPTMPEDGGPVRKGSRKGTLVHRVIATKEEIAASIRNKEWDK